MLPFILQIIKAQDPNCLVLVDNCYGEFTEEQEPTAVGAGTGLKPPTHTSRSCCTSIHTTSHFECFVLPCCWYVRAVSCRICMSLCRYTYGIAAAAAAVAAAVRSQNLYDGAPAQNKLLYLSGWWQCVIGVCCCCCCHTAEFDQIL